MSFRSVPPPTGGWHSDEFDDDDAQDVLHDPVFRNDRGGVVGLLSPDLVLEKRGLSYQRHHLHSFGGWATEARHLRQLQSLNGRGVRLHMKDGKVLESSLHDWLHHSYSPSGLSSRQRVLSDRYWREPTNGHQMGLWS